jgi:uncharacterized membrane protein YfcA
LSADLLFWSADNLGMGLGVLAMPIMALVMPPLQAAAIMLPILIIMDMVNVYVHRKNMRLDIFVRFVPYTVIGIGLGWALAEYTSDDLVRVIIGSISVVFALDYWLFNRAQATAWRPGHAVTAASGSACGFTSFVAHAGGAPFQIFILPQKLAKESVVGTGAITFAAINAIKVPPYFFLGQFSAENLSYAAVLAPLAPIGILLGAYLLRYIRTDIFYNISYAGSFLVGGRLLWVGVVGLGWF